MTAQLNRTGIDAVSIIWSECRRAAAVMAVPSKAMRDRTQRSDNAQRNNPPVDKLELGLFGRLPSSGVSALGGPSGSARV